MMATTVEDMVVTMDVGGEGGGSMAWVLKLGALAAAFMLYCVPLQVLPQAAIWVPVQHHRVSEREPTPNTEVAVLLVRMWLTSAVTLLSLFSAISTQLVIVSCIHAALHFLRSTSRTPLLLLPLSIDDGEGTSDWHWTSSEAGISAWAVEGATLLSFLLVLLFALFPPASALANFRRHRRQLRRFFRRHDQQYEPLVDSLLEDYVGHERLLYASLRRIYRDKLAAAASTAA